MKKNREQADFIPPGRRIGTEIRYARHRGCAPSAVTRAIAERRIHRHHQRQGADCFGAADAQWAIGSRPRADAPGPLPPRGPYQPPDQAEAQDALAAARLRREQAAGELLALRVDREAAVLIERCVIEDVLAYGGATRGPLRGRGAPLGPRAGSAVPAEDHPSAGFGDGPRSRRLLPSAGRFRRRGAGAGQPAAAEASRPGTRRLPTLPTEETAP